MRCGEWKVFNFPPFFPPLNPPDRTCSDHGLEKPLTKTPSRMEALLRPLLPAGKGSRAGIATFAIAGTLGALLIARTLLKVSTGDLNSFVGCEPGRGC